MNRQAPPAPSLADLDTFTRAYLVCALWASTDDSENPLDKSFSLDDFAPEALAKAVFDCRTFRDQCARLAPSGVWRDFACLMSDEQAGHDFWLTRNGHGAGFWDRGLDDIGDRLTDVCDTFGGCDAYVGDDGKIYLT